MEEARGFKGDIGKQKATNKAAKQLAKSQKERRQRKLDDLNARQKSWKGLESRDIRTPAVYFTERESSCTTIDDVRTKLDDLLLKLQAMQNEGNNTPAKSTLINQEIEKVKKRRDKKTDRDKALKIVTHIQSDDEVTAFNSMYEEIDYKIFKRIQPYMKEAGEEMQKQIFGTR